MDILVTGAAGFIGNAQCVKLLEDGHPVASLNKLNDYYDAGLKRARLNRCASFKGFVNRVVDLSDVGAVMNVFDQASPEVVVHLVAQAGARYSMNRKPICEPICSVSSPATVISTARRIRDDNAQ